MTVSVHGKLFIPSIDVVMMGGNSKKLTAPLHSRHWTGLYCTLGELETDCTVLTLATTV
jgi:hypothetical protein